jgi:hypothetical protein
LRVPVAREIPTIAEVTLDHRAYHVRTCRDGFLAVSQEGAFTVLDDKLRVTRRGDFGRPIADASVGTQWAWIADEQLWLGHPDDPRPAAPMSTEAACRWHPSGERLWTAYGTGDEVRIGLGSPEAGIVVPDEFGSAALMMSWHPDPDCVVLWIAAGQDGQQSWLIKDTGVTLAATRLPADDCLPAQFTPDGEWLLTIDHGALTGTSWPDRVERRALVWADVDPDAERDGTDMPGADLLVLPGGFAAWSTDCGRVRTVDLTTMTVVDEITLEGHPVRTVTDIHPPLTDDSPCTDFEYTLRGAGDTVISIHARNTLVLSSRHDWSPRR